MKHTKIHIARILTLLLLAGLMGTACSSNSNMYKHKRSDCDCPTF